MPLKRPVAFAVFQLLLKVIVGVNQLVVNNLAIFYHGLDVGVDEAAVGLEVKRCVALQNFFVEFGVDVYGVGLD